MAPRRELIVSGAADARRALTKARRIVVKVGSNLVTAPGLGSDPDRIERLAADVAAIRHDREVALVSSGAIATGMARLALAERPRSIPEKQAAAAVGQSALMWQYEIAFKRYGIAVGQVLLTAQDIGDRTRYLNARNTLLALLGFGVVPVVNENDTVAVEEIKVGDNDNLSALVASLIEADLLVLLTDVGGLYTADPARQSGATKLDTVAEVTHEILAMAGTHGDGVSVGGMATKLQAAQKAAASGVPMVIASGRERGVLARILSGETVGTYFVPKADRLGARKRWIAFAVPPQGRLIVDAGAARALTRQGRSLLPSGVTAVDGEFAAGDVVAVVDGESREFARGLVNFDAGELRRIRGAKTQEIEPRLGYRSVDEVIHRDNLVIL
ncbi:MAG TPA: glutamate 5-kinase [Methylomirabilota bacterium]|nr:glutamate 5-kinase [Methylomirabilota bacterium]